MTKFLEKLLKFFADFGAHFAHFKDERNFFENLGSVNLLEFTITHHYAKN